MSDKSNVKVIQLIDSQSGKKQPYILQLNQLGKGFYGTVFKAVHKYNPNMIFAVKVIKLQSKQSKNQILKELEIIQKIPCSPNLVETQKHHLQSQKNLYIFQQYCEGGSLAQFRQKNAGRLMKETQIYDMFYQLGRGYIDLYEAGIIHQDIKPSNLLIKGHLYKYCDFGVSQLASKVKHSTSRKGTVSYMPPQKLRQKFLPNPKSDIYSLGVTLYEVIFGFHPYLQKKTKNLKQYLNLLHQARLRPSHELFTKVYNPSVMFNAFISNLQWMICLKQQSRMGIQDLKNLLNNKEPFKDMRIPVQNESPRLIYNKYIDSSAYNIIGQSKIITRLENSDEDNRLINQAYEVQLQQEVKMKEEELKISKLKQEQQNKMYLNLLAEHRIIQAIINYLQNGYKFFKEAFQNVQDEAQCGQTYFENIPQVKEEKVSHVLKLIIMRFNIVIMQNFRQSVQNYQKFYKQTPLTEEIQFLQAQFYKFLAQDNIKEDQTKKLLSKMIRNWQLNQFIQILKKQFQKFFNCIVFLNSIRINFKNDILNGIFLLHVNTVIKALQKLPSISFNGKSSQMSQVMQSSEIQKMDTIIKNFNINKNKKINDLKEQFYKDFKQIQGIVFDAEQNSGQFTDISDWIEDSFQQEENNQEFDVQDLQKI